MTDAAGPDVRGLLREAAKTLELAGIDAGETEASALLAAAWGMRRLEVYLQKSPPPAAVAERFQDWIRRRAGREPLQHLIGRCEFAGISLKVTPAALIPRPETEALVEGAIARAGSARRILDLCTGSGNGILAVAHALREKRGSLDGLELVAAELSAEALDLARENAADLGLAGSITFLQGDLFEAVRAEAPFDLIFSNPPYVIHDDIPRLDPEVKRWDPWMALDGGNDGTFFYAKLAKEGMSHLTPGGRLMVEVGAGTAPWVLALFTEHGWTDAEMLKDFLGLERVVSVAKPPG